MVTLDAARADFRPGWDRTRPADNCVGIAPIVIDFDTSSHILTLLRTKKAHLIRKGRACPLTLVRAAVTTASTVIDGHCLSGYQFEGNILLQVFGCTLARIPIASTAWRLQDQAAVWWYQLETLAPQLLSRQEVYSAACTGASARATLRRMLDPFEHGKEGERCRVSGTDLDLHTQTTAISARATRVWKKLFPPNDDWSPIFDDFDRHRLDAAGKRRCGQAVESRPGP
jgi:hypothetical protein